MWVQYPIQGQGQTFPSPQHISDLPGTCNQGLHKLAKRCIEEQGKKMELSDILEIRIDLQCREFSTTKKLNH